MKVEIQNTADGSPTLYRKDIDEHYHSVKGAMAESSHIYIDLEWRKVSRLHDTINVFEVGFGTGLNAVLTARAALEHRIRTIYHSVELYPLPEETIESLLIFQPEEYHSLYRKIHSAPWEEDVEINSYFILRKTQSDLLTIELPQLFYNVVYFDAFAPEKQPDMWQDSIFRKLYASMISGGILTTYCAKGAIRRMLKNIGFTMERLPGPPGGKREVLRAIKNS